MSNARQYLQDAPAELADTDLDAAMGGATGRRTFEPLLFRKTLQQEEASSEPAGTLASSA